MHWVKIEQEQADPAVLQLVRNIKVMLPDAIDAIASADNIASFNNYINGFFNRATLTEIKVLQPQVVAQIQEGLANSLFADTSAELNLLANLPDEARVSAQKNAALLFNRFMGCLDEAEKQYRIASNNAPEKSDERTFYSKKADAILQQKKNIVQKKEYALILKLAFTDDVEAQITNAQSNVANAMSMFTPEQVNNALKVLAGTGELKISWRNA